MSKKNLKVASMVLSMFATNVYFIYDEDTVDADGKRHGILIDPADKGERIFNTLKDNNFVIDLILLTHGHCDHIGGCEELRKFTTMGSAAVCTNITVLTNAPRSSKVSRKKR